MADEQEAQEAATQAVVDGGAAANAESTEEVIDLGVHGKLPLKEVQQGWGERLMQNRFTQEMTRLAKEREQFKQEREAWEQGKQQQAEPPADIEAEFETLRDDPVYGPGKKLASQLKLTQAALAASDTAKRAIEQRLERVERSAFDRDFNEQFASATSSYAANLTIDREVVRDFIRKRGLDSQPETMVKKAIIEIAGDQFLTQAMQTPAAPAEKPKTLPKSAPKAATKEQQLSPLQDALEAAKRMFA